MTPTQPLPAEVSYCIALIPSEPLFSMVSAASLKISESWENSNLIDNKQFPAHVSLLISGATKHGLLSILDLMSTLELEKSQVSFAAEALYKGGRGFIGVRCTGAALETIQRNALDVAEVGQAADSCVRPHLLERWDRLSTDQKAAVLRYGTYKTGGNDFHLSVAQVDQWDADEAFGVAKEVLRLPLHSRMKCIQLIDVGHHNEKWEIIREWEITS